MYRKDKPLISPMKLFQLDNNLYIYIYCFVLFNKYALLEGKISTPGRNRYVMRHK